MNIESQRLQDARATETPWKKWGPYLSERQWGTVREDYSGDGNAWDYFSHDQARSRAYHWGEDGLAGISDERQRLCFALALWNGKDPIIKERLFGLTNGEGNHGEDVKECYFYLDSTPTHSYMKFLYKYPQAAYPYDDLVRTNRSRGRNDAEYELIDTGVFDQDRYFDVFVEYVKESPEDILVQISVHNRGSEAADCHVLPTLWFRNRWSWGRDNPRPVLEHLANTPGVVRAVEPELGERHLYCDGDPALLFTENETNTERLAGTQNRTPFVKDAVNSYLVHAQRDAVNPRQTGTKVAAHYKLSVPPGTCRVIRLRLTPVVPSALNGSYGEGNGAFGKHFDQIVKARRQEADEFYASVIPSSLDSDAATVMRQALAGMLWSKQFYFFDVKRWLEERSSNPFARSPSALSRNKSWHHMYNADVISMPDKWEYPWYAAWDLAFHVLALTMVDADFGKSQLELMLRESYLHPNGQMPAYEWNFGDVNPPVHAWATIFTYRLEQGRTGQGDVAWLERSFQKLLLSFSWWVNRKDRAGNNAFEGGFLGLDNIGVFDRSAPLPTGGHLEQADGTAWMALFSLNMLEINFELALRNPAYEEMALKFVQHFCSIGAATIHAGGNVGMWDEEDGFFYDVLQLPDGRAQRLKVRSMVGLLPLCAVAVFESKELREKSPELAKRCETFFETHRELLVNIHDPTKDGCAGRRLGAILDENKLRRVLARMLDEKEFLGPYGLRALSRFHAENPYVFHVGEEEYRVGYLPGESDNGMFGGNSNWRGPVWMPVNALILRALLQYYGYYGNEFTVECPTGSGRRMNLYQVAEEITRRLSRLFLRDDDGRRPVNAGAQKFEGPHWRDCIQFYEYFHGDSGAGLGASHQTGWTGVVARAMHLFATMTPEQLLEGGAKGVAQALAKGAPGSV